MTTKYIALAAAALTLASCNDFLDKLPDERVEIGSTDQVVQLLSSAYSTGNYGWLCEVSSDNIIDINCPFMATQNDGKEIRVYYNLAYYGREDQEAFQFEPVKSSTDSDSPSSVWDGCYGAIAACNHALQALDRMKAEMGGKTTPQMDAAYGEAYISRAYHHFILVNIFSQAYKNAEASKADIGVPYVTEPEHELIKTYDRGNVAQVYDSIEADLNRGLPLISDINYKMPKWHFTENATHAFAARFYLYKRDYAKVIEHANKVLGNDYETINPKLADYTKFDDCTYLKDYCNIWQGPDQANNLLLIGTYSTQFRRCPGYRYACAGKALRDIEFHLGPNWRWYMMPCAGVGGGTFWDGTSDHGYASAKVGEQFEYTDKIAGIGYAHVVRREFTATELLLDRAEAYLMSGDVDNCVNDILAYDKNRFTFSESNNKFYRSGNALTDLTRKDIETYYAKPANCNVLTDWSFTQNMSPDYIIPKDREVYMNAVNDMRRYELAYTGHRFFDLKRWGMTWSHTFGDADSQTTITLEWNDPRRAIELPQEVLAAGMPTSQPTPVKVDNSASQYVGGFLKKD